MNRPTIQQLVESIDPFEAAEEMAVAAKRLFSLLGEPGLRDFLARLIGEESRDKITGLGAFQVLLE